MDYTTLSLAELRTGFDDLAREAQATFGRFDARRLNWKPSAAQWSVAQCFDHLLRMNRLMFQAAETAMQQGSPRTLWQRLPMLPGVLGRLMVRSQAPGSTRKYSAPAPGRPSSSDIGADVVLRFLEQQREAVARLSALDEQDAARTIMASPFIKVLPYSVLDSWRLVFAHERRHLEQARRVTTSPGFPG